MRGFEKIDFEEFKKSISEDRKLYDELLLPERKTKYSCGYDFYLVDDFVLKPGVVTKIPTGIKSYFLNDEILSIYIRSSIAIKKGIIMRNQVGIVDADYYGNKDNGGHLFLALFNTTEEEVFLQKGERIVQGIFTKYLIGDDTPIEERKGGIGSTNEGEN